MVFGLQANRFSFPATPPKLNLRHPAFRNGAGRLATVSRTDGSQLDLVTNTIGTWSGAAGRGSAMGPVAFPKTTTSGGILWPPIIPGEVLGNFTMAFIAQANSFTHGQNPTSFNNGSTQIGMQSPSGAFSFGEAGSAVFLNLPNAVPGHWYFWAVSQWNITGHPRTAGALLDMTTGQIWIAQDRGANWGPQTLTAGYNTLTYGGGLVDSNPVAANMLSATNLTQQQLVEWCSDPFGAWYDRSAVHLMSSGVRSIGQVADLAGDLAPGVTFGGALGKIVDLSSGDLAPGVAFGGDVSKLVGLSGNISPQIMLFASDISNPIEMFGRLSPDVEFGADLSMALTLAGDMPPQVALGASLTTLIECDGDLPVNIAMSGSSLTSGPLWVRTQPCSPVDWEETELCNG